MSERRANRGLSPRTDQQILDHPTDMWLLAAVAAGRVTRSGPHLNAAHLIDGELLNVNLRRLAREDLLFAPIGTSPTIAARGARLLLRAGHEVVHPS